MLTVVGGDGRSRLLRVASSGNPPPYANVTRDVDVDVVWMVPRRGSAGARSSTSWHWLASVPSRSGHHGAPRRADVSGAIAAERESRVVAAAVLELRVRVRAVPGATVLQLDLTEPGDISTLRSHLPASEDRCCNVLLSDMAPATTGQHALDHHRSMVLGSIALRLSRELLSPGGSAVVKLFQGGGERRLLQWAKQHFETARFAKPPGSKKKSKEVFLVATGFQPPPPPPS